MLIYFVLLGDWNSSEYDIHTGGGLFNPTREKHMLKRVESHRCEVNILWKFFVILARFFKVSRRDFFRKWLTESEGSNRF